MAGAASNGPSTVGLQRSSGSFRRRSKTDRVSRETGPSFTTAGSQSTIPTKQPIQSNISSNIPVGGDGIRQSGSAIAVATSQSNLSAKSVSSRQQKIMTMMRKSRSSSRDSRRSRQRQEEESSPAQGGGVPRVQSFSRPKPPMAPPPSASLKFSPYGNSGIVSRHSAGIPRVSTPNNRASPSGPDLYSPQSYVPRSPSTASARRVGSSLSRGGGSVNERSVFHVRLSIGYLMGLKMEKIAKWTRQPSNKHIIVGFVELASSGKYTALSQPLLTNIGESSRSITRIVWANPRGGKDSSKLRRRLHFSLQLERDGALDGRDDQRDDDSFASMGSYSPEVVKLLVGLKCGDEKLNLGTAKLVINGRETVEQKMDLTMQPATGSSSAKTKRGLFGKKQTKKCFTNGDHTFKIAPNATLRVKADIRTGLPGQDGASVWGNDDSSYTTAWTYDTSSALPLSPPGSAYNGMITDPPSFGMMPSHSNGAFLEEQRVGIETTGAKDSSLFGESPTAMQYDPSARHLRPRIIHTVPPLSVVALQKKEDKSYMSGLTGPGEACDGNWWSKACTSLLCGEVEDAKHGCRGLVAKSFSFDTMSQRLSDDIQASSDSSSSEDSSTEPGEDLKGKLIHVRNDYEVSGTNIKQKQQMKASKPRDQDTEENVETLDVTVETYNDLKDAQETLIRYANKVGVNMDQLLEVMEESQKHIKKRSPTDRRSLKL